jgi:arylsulfatase A-like enzyme
MYLAHVAPHDPRQYPARFQKNYSADKVSLPDNFMPQHPFDNGELRVRDEMLEDFPRQPHAVRQHIADYYALIAMIDEQVGRVLDALDKAGETENTIIVFAGDNGLAVGQHGLMGKQNLYDHSVRVPLIMAGPGIPKGQKTDAFCYLLDIFPTLCELTNTTIPDSVEGKSLVPVLRDPSSSVRDSLYFAYKGFQRAAKVGKYKLIEYAVKGNRTQQLFDLEADPLEMKNLVASPKHRSILVKLEQEIQRCRTELDDDKKWGQAFWGSAK